MAQIAIATASQYKNASEAVGFLEQKAKDLKANTDSYALLLTMAANNYISESKFDQAKALLEQVQGILDGSLGLDPMVYSQFYRILAVFHKNQVHAGDFYKAGLLYLAYTALESVPANVQRLLARDLALAGLTAEDVYGMGELLGHPVVEALRSDPDNAWLLELVNAYNSGRIPEWNLLKEKFKAQIAAHSSLIMSLSLVEEKIAILALVELIWSRPADGRSLAFADVALATHLPVDRIELLVMRAMSLGVVKGEIDEVSQVVMVTGVKPRVLSPDQIVETGNRVKLWKEHVQRTLVTVEQTELAQ